MHLKRQQSLTIQIMDSRVDTGAERLSVLEQVARGLLVCPVTLRVLGWSADGSQLVTQDSSATYRLLSNGTPVLVSNEAALTTYSRESEMMNADYSAPRSSVFSRIAADRKSVV